ncbi:helix-turn-helix domain-containing protein [Pseudarthrobacter sp. J64]|uniref:PucR family transcriptional regulator n=1 Tax=Pseudarthrobacter sp. J64 TaxID=3116485 RepID=UPI002E7FE7CF|nr:helix-turn-helix domain-containing protein [Pseudarthrobacter sp. J64]MEE2570357.1 helix-turn-helix domain-containing protein [Pseudarthrobacter sp. J64]
MQQDVEQLVEQVAGKLGRGLSLEDLDGMLLAYSSNQSHADRVRVNFLLSKKVPSDVSAWQLSHGIATAVRPVAIPANPELGMLGRVCVPLTVRGFRVGYLWVQQDAEEESPTAILSQLPDVQRDIELLSGLLLESNTVESGFRRGREREFLAACDGDVNATATVAGWREVQHKGPWQAVTALDADGWAGGADPGAATLIHSSAALQSTVGVDAALFSAGAETHSVILFRESVGRASHAQVLVHYQLELAKRSGRPVHRIILGISEPFARPRGLAAAYRQSKVAAQAAAVEPRLGELVDYKSTGVYQVLASAGGAAAWSDSGSVYFQMLEDHDRNGELLPVLELLYDNDGSVQDVAGQLHLHRSSIYNRLGRVRQLLGVDPLKGAVRLELHAAMKARRWDARPRI